MTTEIREKETNSVDGRSIFGFLLAGILVLGSGCCPVTPPPPDVQPDMKAVAVVVEDAFGRLGEAASVFLAADGVEDTTMVRVRSTLGDGLASTFRPPSARISGDPGAGIVLGRFNLEDDGRLSVVASFVQEDGSGRGCTQYTLDREGDDWIVVTATDAWPDCPISTQGEDIYHAVLARARSGECLRLGTAIGTCGQWLYVVESSGYHGTRSYFDPQTGLIVAQERFTDADETDDLFVFGHVECDPAVTDRIPCDR